METHVEIGKSILNKYSDYAKTEIIDDETEFFPTVKVIIDGVAGTLESTNDKEKIKSILIDHVKQHYVSLWVKNATKDGESPDVDYVKKRASNEFERLYYDQKSH